MKKYTAITIGPIYETMQLARSTKAIWSASYMFSYIMRELLACVKAKNDLEIILPFSENIEGVVTFDEEKSPKDTNDEILPVGLFPDYLLIKGEWTEEDFTECREKILEEVKEGFKEDLQSLDKYVSVQKNDLDKRIKKYLENHIQIRRICVKLDENDNHILKLYKLCETAELFNTTNPHAQETFLSDYFEKYKTTVKEAEYNDVVRQNFKKKGRPFKSTAEIATAEFEDKQFYKEASEDHILDKKDKTKEEIGYDTQNEFYNDIKRGAGNRFKFHHKYIAIVQADGDSVGGLIKKIYEGGKSSKIEEFSKSLLAFSVKATQAILAYNGSAVYSGGDDLLFFAPVAHTDENGKTVKTILDLIEKIDKIFEKQILKNSELSDIVNKLETKPTMSYGVHIAYYKFPLDQALENVWSLLVNKAKKEDGKNAIALKVTKHSGQVFETILKKNQKTIIENVERLFKETGVEDNFISNFMYKLSPLSVVIKNIGRIQGGDERNKRFGAFFENYFNENIHKQSLEDGFLSNAKELLKEIYGVNSLTGFSNERYKEINEKINISDNQNNEKLKSMIFDNCMFIENDEYKEQLSQCGNKDEKEKLIKEIYMEELHQRNINQLYAILRFYQFINAKSE